MSIYNDKTTRHNRNNVIEVLDTINFIRYHLKYLHRIQVYTETAVQMNLVIFYCIFLQPESPDYYSI